MKMISKKYREIRSFHLLIQDSRWYQPIILHLPDKRNQLVHQMD